MRLAIFDGEPDTTRTIIDALDPVYATINTVWEPDGTASELHITSANGKLRARRGDVIHLSETDVVHVTPSDRYIPK